MKEQDGMSNEAIQFWFGRASFNWRCEEEIKSSCQIFAELWPECVPAPGNRSSFYVGIRRIVREFGEKRAPGFIKWSKEELERENMRRARQGKGPLHVVDAHSIGWMIPGYKKKWVNQCPECGRGWRECKHDFGSRARQRLYGGDHA